MDDKDYDSRDHHCGAYCVILQSQIGIFSYTIIKSGSLGTLLDNSLITSATKLLRRYPDDDSPLRNALLSTMISVATDADYRLMFIRSLLTILLYVFERGEQLLHLSLSDYTKRRVVQTLTRKLTDPAADSDVFPPIIDVLDGIILAPLPDTDDLLQDRLNAIEILRVIDSTITNRSGLEAITNILSDLMRLSRSVILRLMHDLSLHDKEISTTICDVICHIVVAMPLQPLTIPSQLSDLLPDLSPLFRTSNPISLKAFWLSVAYHIFSTEAFVLHIRNTVAGLLEVERT